MTDMQLINKTISWIRKKLKESGLKGIVLGLSGGIDSAVVAELCRRAAGRGRTLCLIIPCESMDSDTKDAVFVAKELNLDYKVRDITDIYRKISLFIPGASRTAKGNLKARLRMLLLYYFANSRGYIVAGTGNRTELSIGYFTKYGDGASDILPIGGMLKRDVRRIALKLGIPERIIKKAPTAGLWEGQTDEGDIGMSYAELDEIIEGLSGAGKIKADRNKINKVRKLIAKNKHKRLLPEIFNNKTEGI